eukprot:1714114-Rhodomonas_salina.1
METEAVPADASVSVIDSRVCVASDETMATFEIATPRRDATSLVWPIEGEAKPKTAREVSMQVNEESTVTLECESERMVKVLAPLADSDGTQKERMLLVKVATSVIDVSDVLVKVTPSDANSTSMSWTLESRRMFVSATTTNADAPSQTPVAGSSFETSGAPVGTATYSMVVDT